MKQLFLDVTSSNYDGANGAICVIRKDAEIIQAGTTISSMPTELKDEEYQKFIDCYDIHFIYLIMALNVDFTLYLVSIFYGDRPSEVVI